MADEVLLTSIGSRRAPILVKLTTWKGLRFLDIRKYYTIDGGLQPTRKGISLRAHGVEAVMQVLDNHGEDVLAFLEGETGLEENLISARAAEEAAEVEQIRFGQRELEVATVKEGRAGMFHISSSGDRDTVTLNGDHPFVMQATSHEEISIIAEMLAAYARARELLVTDEDEGALFAELEYTWGRVLRTSRAAQT